MSDLSPINTYESWFQNLPLTTRDKLKTNGIDTYLAVIDNFRQDEKFAYSLQSYLLPREIQKIMSFCISRKQKKKSSSNHIEFK